MVRRDCVVVDTMLAASVVVTPVVLAANELNALEGMLGGGGLLVAADPEQGSRARFRVPSCAGISCSGAATGSEQPSLRGAEVYLDESADAFLKACRAAGEVSNSAVIRLALLELSSTMTPIEVARVLLLGDNSARRVPGRKARH